ncbi:glycosyltransferase family 2 protein [Mucilaginibacter arboris]|uniref:Glycosyltransferase n=1 Tax=Mucilaginibacter arboris TaxID=2682090 RepID=A0A7K1SVM4_9SPHI|nr:glycosyltransferase family 2 protein [Mucilaginibacter arboris]MVN21287.1 glycosyltransferase [Mucilaginibacter arboris]
MIRKRSISVILPNYNGAYLLEKYLPFTLTAIQNAGVVYEVIVVDDASKDRSIHFLLTHYPEIILICNPQNKGFSHTCNTGIQAAKHELIFLLNTDVKLTPDYFEHQWRYFEREDTFGVMGRIIDMEGDHIQDAARTLAFNGFKIKTNRFFYSENPADFVPTAYLSGANALIDAKKLKAIDGFNELFSPFYGEDFEMGLRAWRLGWKCWYEHQSVCRHLISASTNRFKSTDWVKSIYYRNRFFVHAIHLDGFNLGCWYLQILLIDLLPQLITGKFWMLKSYIQLFRQQTTVKFSKKKLTILIEKHSCKKSITDVAAELNSIIKNIKIIYLK